VIALVGDRGQYFSLGFCIEEDVVLVSTCGRRDEVIEEAKDFPNAEIFEAGDSWQVEVFAWLTVQLNIPMEPARDIVEAVVRRLSSGSEDRN